MGDSAATSNAGAPSRPVLRRKRRHRSAAGGLLPLRGAGGVPAADFGARPGARGSPGGVARRPAHCTFTPGDLNKGFPPL